MAEESSKKRFSIMVGMIDVASMVVQEQPQAKRTGKDTESEAFTLLPPRTVPAKIPEAFPSIGGVPDRAGWVRGKHRTGGGFCWD